MEQYVYRRRFAIPSLANGELNPAFAEEGSEPSLIPLRFSGGFTGAFYADGKQGFQIDRKSRVGIDPPNEPSRLQGGKAVDAEHLLRTQSWLRKLFSTSRLRQIKWVELVRWHGPNWD